MVEILRNKWSDDLEELVQCPICMERPYVGIHQCIEGHHICDDCKSQLAICPTCGEHWSSSRNRLAENLVFKLDEIKLSLLDPEGEINRLLIPDRVSVGSQTDENIVRVSDPPPLPRKKKTNKIHYRPETYLCQVGNCDLVMLFEPLMEHIQNDHSNEYLELSQRDKPVFEHTWFIECSDQMTFDRVFKIAYFRTFFLKLSTDVFGNFTGFVSMMQNSTVSKQYSYQLEVSCCDKHNGSTYTGEVVSCRMCVGSFLNKCLRIKRAKMQRLMSHSQELKCTLLLVKKSETEGETQRLTTIREEKNAQKNEKSEETPVASDEGEPRPGPSNVETTDNVRRSRSLTRSDHTAKCRTSSASPVDLNHADNFFEKMRCLRKEYQTKQKIGGNVDCK